MVFITFPERSNAVTWILVLPTPDLYCEHSVVGNAECLRRWPGPQTFGHWYGLAGKTGPFSIKRLRHQGALAHEQQMPGRRVHAFELLAVSSLSSCESSERT